jgi:hypothetical protein
MEVKIRFDKNRDPYSFARDSLALPEVRAEISKRLKQPEVWTAALGMITSALKANRDPRHAAPWNSAMYLDINAALLRRNSDALALARKEFIAQQRPFKKPAFYYALAREVERSGYEAELRARASQASSSA